MFDESFRIAGDYEFFARAVVARGIISHHIGKVLAVFSGHGVSEDPKLRSLRKRENHRIRWQYFPRYRWTLKSMRQQVRNLLT